MNWVLKAGAYLLVGTLLVWLLLVLWAKYHQNAVLKQATQQITLSAPTESLPGNALATPLTSVTLPAPPPAPLKLVTAEPHVIKPQPAPRTKPQQQDKHQPELLTKQNNVSPVQPQEVVKAEKQPAQNSQQIYEQLSEDASLSIQLAWPAGHAEREALFTYLYQCVGAELALLQGQALTIVSPKRYKARSQWLRVAQGEMSRQEKHWLRAANAAGTPVRLVPESLDYNLANHIASALSQSGSTSQSLQALRGRYQLSGKQLYLTDIQLNGESVQPKWLLHTGGSKTAC